MTARLATDKDLMTCCICKRRFKEGEEVFIKADGWPWNGVIVIDNSCREKYYSNLKIRATK